MPAGNYGQTQQDVRREQDNERRKKRGADADAAAESKINEGDLGAAARKAKGQAETMPATGPAPSTETMPIKPGPGATLGEIGEYNRKMKAIKERQALSGMSAGSQAKALK